MSVDSKLKQQLKEKVIVVEQSIFQCTFQNCTKQFKTKFALKRHSLIHSSERDFKCSKCGKLFSLPQYLREHANTHTKDKPYVCGVGGCQERFRQAGKLSIHRRTHPEYTVKKYKYSLNPKKRKLEEANSSNQQLKEKESEQSSANMTTKRDELQNQHSQLVLENNLSSKKDDSPSKSLPSIALFFPIDTRCQCNMNKSVHKCNTLRISLNVNVPPYSFPMMQCLPWLTLPCKAVFHPVLPFPIESMHVKEKVGEEIRLY